MYPARLFYAGALLLSLFVPARADLIIGGFNLSRGGLESIADSSSLSGLRTAIDTAFPGTTFTDTGTLTSTYLSTVNVVVLGVASGDITPIAPLSSSEQANLVNFVDNGGTAVIFADNNSFNTYAPRSNASLLSPFGLTIGGSITGTQQGTYLTGGGTLTAYNPGEFTNVGKSTILATYNVDNQPAVTYLPAGTLSSGSGAVVFFSDSSLMLDSLRTPADQQDILNAIRLATGDDVATPEPGTFAFLAAGLLLAPLLKKRAQ